MLKPKDPIDRSKLVTLDKRHVWHPYTAMDRYEAEDPIVVANAEGPYFWDLDGTRYLDANGSWWVSTLGHRHPRLVRALTAQAETLAHVALAGCTHAPAAQLAEELAAIAPGDGTLSRVFYSDDGSTAVESAVKMAAQYWAQNGRAARHRFVALGEAFHGETVGASSLGGIASFRDVFRPLLFEARRVAVPSEPGGWEQAIVAVERLLKTEGDAIAGVVVEPLLQGAGGMRVHPPPFLRELRALTRAADTFLIADEVFTGLGRTGRWFACELAGVVPDLLCLAKGLSGGLLPFACTLATERIFDGFRGDRARAFFYGHSYAGNPLGAAVAREVLAVYRDEEVLAQVEARAPRLARHFEALAGLAGVERPRSLGMVAAVDLGRGGYLADAGWKVYAAARRRGLYLRPLGDTVYVAPPLNLPEDAFEELLGGVEDSIREAIA